MSVYATALNGLQTQAHAVQQYAHQLAVGTAISSGSNGALPQTVVPQDVVDFSQSAIDAIIGLGVAENNFKANAAVIRTMSEMEDALLDIIA